MSITSWLAPTFKDRELSFQAAIEDGYLGKPLDVDLSCYEK
ncbi:hypothetical protein [Amycolatopsis sp. WAC 01375]|nr:hypothetical protein [Amycolatopsis sp. WAC 01375]